MDVYPGGKRMYAPYDDITPELKGRQSKRTNIDHNLSSDDDTEYRILCPNLKFDALIGKGGARIQALRLEYKSKIRVEDEVPGSDERVICICSTSRKDPRLPLSVCPAQEALMRVHTNIIADDNGDIPQSVTARLLIPHVQIGCLIGRRGKIIKQLRHDIPCQICVLQKEQLPACALESDELMQLVGDPLVVEKALHVVSSRLYENPLRERKGFQGPNNIPLMTGGHKLDDYDASLVAPLRERKGFQGPNNIPLMTGGHKLDDYDASLVASMPLGGPGLGRGGHSGIGSAWSSGPRPHMGPFPGHTEREPEQELILRILCPNDKIGSVIGKGGSIIGQLQKESQAKIQVCDSVPGADEQIIEITSTEVMDSFVSRGIDAAMLVHRRLVDVQKERDGDVNVFTVLLLVPTKSIGCLLGKGGSVINELRNFTRANIKIHPESDLPKCANKNEDLVQVMGDQYVVHDALLQILSRLRANLFKGYKGPPPPLSGIGYGSFGYGEGRFDADAPSGGTYSLANTGYEVDFGSYGSSAFTTQRYPLLY